MNKPFTLNGEEYSAVGVSKQSYRFCLITNKELKNRYGKLEWAHRDNGLDHAVVLNNIEQYEILGKLSELLEEECRPLVETLNTVRYVFPYKDYINFNSSIKTAKESLFSLLRAEGIDAKLLIDEPKKEQFIFTGYGQGYDIDKFVKAMEAYNALPDDILLLKIKK